jgi:hypothetical protein
VATRWADEVVQLGAEGVDERPDEDKIFCWPEGAGVSVREMGKVVDGGTRRRLRAKEARLVERGGGVALGGKISEGVG